MGFTIYTVGLQACLAGGLATAVAGEDARRRRVMARQGVAPAAAGFPLQPMRQVDLADGRAYMCIAELITPQCARYAGNQGAARALSTFSGQAYAAMSIKDQRYTNKNQSGGRCQGRVVPEDERGIFSLSRYDEYI